MVALLASAIGGEEWYGGLNSNEHLRFCVLLPVPAYQTPTRCVPAPSSRVFAGSRIASFSFVTSYSIAM